MSDSATAASPPPDTFDVIPIVISHYHSYPELKQADEEAERVAAILSRWGARLSPWEVPASQRSLEPAVARLERWSRPESSRRSLLFWIGHGTSNDEEAVIQLRAGDLDVGLGPEELARHVVREHRLRDERDWAIVVVETCGAILFVQRMLEYLERRQVRDGILLIGSGEDRGEGYLGTFRRALEQVEKAYSPNDTVVSLHDLAGRLEQALTPGLVRTIGVARCSPLVARHDLTPTLTTAVEFYPDLRDVLDDLPRADLEQLARSGLGAELLEIGSHFAGRTAERTAVVTWLETHETGLLVLSGPGGSGKSALLANLLLHAVPALRLALERAPQLGDGWADGHRLPSVDGTVLLTGATISEVVTRLAGLTGVAIPAGRRPQEEAETLVRALAERTTPLTFFADALDESRDPHDIAGLLGRLANHPGVRIVLATRQGAHAGRGDLLDSLRGPGSGSGVTVQFIHNDPAAILEFAAARLRSVSDEVPPVGLDDTLADLAARLPDRTDQATGRDPGDEADGGSGWDFLRIRLLVSELLARPELLTGAFAAERRRMMSLDRTTLFRQTVDRLEAAFPPVTPFLLALASAQGRGLPRADRIWATVAGALSPGRTFTEAEVDAVLSAAGPCIMLDAEDGRSVFRLAHRALTDDLRRRLDQPAQAAVLGALVDLAREAGAPAPYLRRHLSGHAAELGREGWAILDTAAGVLDHLDLPTLLADTWRSAQSDLSPRVRAIRRTAHLAMSGTAEDRCGYRQLGTALEAGLYSPTVEPAPGAAWQVSRARLIRHPSHQTNSPGPAIPVRSLAVCTTADGTVVVASGDDRGRIRLWNPWESRLLDLQFDVLQSGEVLGLAGLSEQCGAPGLMLASVGAGQPIRLWPVRADQEPSEFPEQGGGTRCVVTTARHINGSLLLAVGTINGRLRLCSPDRPTENRLSTPLVGHSGRITGLATIDGLDGRELVSVSVDGSLRRWSLPEGRPGPRIQWPRPLKSVTVVERAGLIVTGDDTGTVAVWRRPDPEPVLSFSAHDGAVLALALLPDDGDRTTLVSGGADRRVRLWDAFTGERTGRDLTGHDDEVTALVTLRSPEGAPLVASGSRDGKIKIWTPQALSPSPSAPPRRGRRSQDPPEQWRLVTTDGRSVTVVRTAAGRVICQLEESPAVTLPAAVSRPRCAAALTSGDVVVVATSTQSVIRTWTADLGTAAGPPLRGHQDWVRALLALEFEGAPAALVSGGDDGRVCLWDPRSGDLLRRIEFGEPIHSLTSVGGRRFTVVLEDGDIEIEVEDDLLHRPAEGTDRDRGK